MDAQKRSELRKLLVTHLDRDDLKTICFDMEIDLDYVARSGTLSDQVRSLLILLNESSRGFDELLDCVHSINPSLDLRPFGGPDPRPPQKRKSESTISISIGGKEMTPEDLTKSDGPIQGKIVLGDIVGGDHIVAGDGVTINRFSGSQYNVGSKDKSSPLSSEQWRDLRTMLTTHLSIEDLKTIYFDWNIESQWHVVAGDTVRSVTRRLLSYIRKRPGAYPIDELFEIVHEIHPKIDFSSFGGPQPKATNDVETKGNEEPPVAGQSIWHNLWGKLFGK